MITTIVMFVMRASGCGARGGVCDDGGSDNGEQNLLRFPQLSHNQCFVHTIYIEGLFRHTGSSCGRHDYLYCC